MRTEKLHLRNGEEIIEEKKGDTWKTPEMPYRKQISGRFYFTNQRVAFRTWGPFQSSAAYDIEYKDIAELNKFSINFFIKTGIKIIMKDGLVYKISVMKRNKYIEIITRYLG